MYAESGEVREVSVEPQAHEEAGVFVAQVSSTRSVVQDPRGVDLGRVGDAQTRSHAVVELWPPTHVGRRVYVGQVHRCVPVTTHGTQVTSVRSIF